MLRSTVQVYGECHDSADLESNVNGLHRVWIIMLGVSSKS